MSDVTIWHNPRCTKSRQTLALLTEQGIEPTVRLYLTDAPTSDEIRAAIAALGVSAITMVRTGETEFKSMGLKKSDPVDALIAAMTECPKLIERPIVFKGKRAAIGRPPETVLEIL